MNAITIGPLMLSVDRLVALAGILAFIAVTTIAARKGGAGVARWSTTGLVVGIIAARIAHVVINWSTFAENSWRAVAVWQGGFFWPAGVLAALILLLVQVRDMRGRIAGLAGLAVGLFVWNAASLLTSGVDPVPLPGNPLQTLGGEKHCASRTRQNAHGDQPLGHMVSALPARDADDCRSRGGEQQRHFRLREPG